MLHTITGKVALSALLFLLLITGLGFSSIQGSLAERRAIDLLTVATDQMLLHQQFLQVFNRTIAESINASARQEAKELAQAKLFFGLAVQAHDALNQLELRNAGVRSAPLSAQRAEVVGQLGRVLDQIEASMARGDELLFDGAVEMIEDIEADLDTLVAAQIAYTEQIIDANESELLGLISFAQIAVPVQFGLISLITAWAIWLLHQFIVQPVRLLAQSATAIGEGQLDQAIVTQGIDEIGTLQRALQQTAVNLGDREQAIKAYTGELQVALAEIEAGPRSRRSSLRKTPLSAR
ncbi:MAG: HAMP domain-containing protein [Roseiflexaceae bacterium]|nr:HAMP domain-containing protein [Roseiflexaceae bacterium]